jgi:hypothetical protein
VTNQDLRQELNLGHYEDRGWCGFHHYAMLAFAAHGFLLSERATIATPPSIDPSAPSTQGVPIPIRPERHVSNSIATIQVLIASALVRSLRLLGTHRDHGLLTAERDRYQPRIGLHQTGRNRRIPLRESLASQGEVAGSGIRLAANKFAEHGDQPLPVKVRQHRQRGAVNLRCNGRCKSTELLAIKEEAHRHVPSRRGHSGTAESRRKASPTWMPGVVSTAKALAQSVRDAMGFAPRIISISAAATMVIGAGAYSPISTSIGSRTIPMRTPLSACGLSRVVAQPA